MPLFYLFFCLVLAQLILHEQTARRDYQVLSEELRNLADRLMEANVHNLHLYTSTIKALAAAVEAKDPYTAGHSDRVTRYAEKIARQIGLTEEEVCRISYAAILHDIGKIGISSSILHKPGRLTPEEYQEICEHPAIGAHILSSIELLGDIIPMVYHHHEWYNGKGYPQGLAGEEIPLGARIIAVADAFDAMTSNRPYRTGLSFEQAVAEIQRQSGIQFDPRVAQTLLAILQEEQVTEEKGVPAAGRSAC